MCCECKCLALKWLRLQTNVLCRKHSQGPRTSEQRPFFVGRCCFASFSFHSFRLNFRVAGCDSIELSRVNYLTAGPQLLQLLLLLQWHNKVVLPICIRRTLVMIMPLFPTLIISFKCPCMDSWSFFGEGNEKRCYVALMWCQPAPYWLFKTAAGYYGFYLLRQPTAKTKKNKTKQKKSPKFNTIANCANCQLLKIGWLARCWELTRRQRRWNNKKVSQCSAVVCTFRAGAAI